MPEYHSEGERENGFDDEEEETIQNQSEGSEDFEDEKMEFASSSGDGHGWRSEESWDDESTAMMEVIE